MPYSQGDQETLKRDISYSVAQIILKIARLVSSYTAQSMVGLRTLMDLCKRTIKNNLSKSDLKYPGRFLDDKRERAAKIETKYNLAAMIPD
jgi:hypothetical protein